MNLLPVPAFCKTEASFFGMMVVAVVSLPLAAVSANSFFGLGSVLVVPALAAGLWCAVWTRNFECRAWWLGLTLAVGLFLPACPASMRLSQSVAVYVQRLTQRGSFVNVIELCCLLATVLVPLLCACLVGIAGGNLARGIAHRAARGRATEIPDGARWQFSVRELLSVVAALSLVLAWNGHFLAVRGARERQNQLAFLARFEESFRSDEIQLLADPVVSERQGATVSALSFKPPGMNEYRIVAPIKRDGVRRWAVWAYTTSEDDREFIYQYGCTEVESEDQLPQLPEPVKRHIEGTWELVDGVPSTAGPSATVIGVVTPARLGQPLVVTARAAVGTVCELKVFPLTEATRLAQRAPDNKGIVRWSWTPEWAGPFQYELRCIDNRASGRLVNCCRGTIPQFKMDSVSDQ